MQTTTNQLNFIEGQFTAEEAKEILINIFTTKIKFHELKNFSSQIRNGHGDDFAQKRILFLNEELKKIQTIIEEANTLNKKLIIKSEIYISLEDE
jgi:hypothetical protein